MGYFTEIIDPLVDKQFFMAIPNASRLGNASIRPFFSGMTKNGSRLTYMRLFITRYYFVENFITKDFHYGVGENPKIDIGTGRIINKKDVHYLYLSNFKSADYVQIKLVDKYLQKTINDDNYSLNQSSILNNNYLNNINDKDIRENLKKVSLDFFLSWDKFLKEGEEDINSFNNFVKHFNETEEISQEFIDLTQKIYSNYILIVKNGYDFFDIDSEGIQYTDDLKELNDENIKKYIDWYNNQIYNLIVLNYSINEFILGSNNIIRNGNFYKNFLNPLHKGEIKKLIIDLRYNWGGDLKDFEYLTNRFITNESVWGYQRTKEGVGRTNYSPWLPKVSQKHKFGIPKNIPIVILTDTYTASLAELITEKLKNQGPHIISVGEYSMGATTYLSDNKDLYNGGYNGGINNVISIRMPGVVFKDANGNLIEGIGCKPNIEVEGVTTEELIEILTSQSTDYSLDRVLKRAIEYLETQ